MKKNSYSKNFFVKGILFTSSILIVFFLIFAIILPGNKEVKEGAPENSKFKEEVPFLPANGFEIQTIGSVEVYKHEEDEIEQIELEEYLLGVVAAEMPPDFEEEALKAQAVVARTYTISRLSEFEGKGCIKKQEADICTNPDHCQDWMSREEAIETWGKNGNKLWEKIKSCVLDTRGYVITYNDEPVTEALYHSTCGGKTEPTSKVWGEKTPYIEPVYCEYCLHSDKYTDKKTFAEGEIADLLLPPGENLVEVTDESDPPVKITRRSSSGRVTEAKVGEKEFTGIQVREKLGLNSTNFELESTNKGWVFHTTGFGHGVGLCQYGADGKANEGYNYTEILQYFFSDVEIKKLY